ncbi:MAG TPA: SGNH/GDSL hydrolase family protein [Gaiellaceae bacterium]|nr:SGNH/GDSL hydrolase family protein [Gaiellaceae bacterium]
MSLDEGMAHVATGAPELATRRRRLGWLVATVVVWLAGSGVTVVAQPDSDRRLAAAGAAAAGILAILVIARFTADPGRRYLRSLVAAIVAVSLTSEWLLWHLHAASSGFEVDGMVKRIALPLLVVLPAPLVLRSLWEQRAAMRLRALGPMDSIVGAYATVVLLPALFVGLYHHNRLSYIGQDLGLIVFFVFMYLAGRAVTAEAARASAAEIMEALLLVAVAKIALFHWDTFPLYSYMEAACAAALAYLLLRPRASRLLLVGVGVTLLAFDGIQIHEGTQASVAVEVAGALGILAYLGLRARRLLPQWLLVAVALVAAAGFVGMTSDGAALRGRYYGPDPSNAGRSYEANRVRAAVGHAPSTALVGQGLGGTIDETNAPPLFRQTLVYGGRDLAHVQEIHLLLYSFLLKTGYLGLAWLATFLIGLAILVFRTLERAARERDPRLVLYAALPLLAVVQAMAAASHFQANPLTGLTLGTLVTCLGARRTSTSPISIRTHRNEILAGAACTLAGLVVVGYLSAHWTFGTQSVSLPNQPIALWIGDSYTAGAGATTSATGEALATSGALGWQSDMDAEGSSGYVARGRRQSPTNDAVPARIASDAASFTGVDVVLIDAGRNDVGHPPKAFRRAVVSSFDAVAKGFPSSAVVVIAPFLMTSKQHSFLAMRRVLRQQARIHRFAYVDPIAEGWINRASAKLVVSDRIHPNQQGYDYIVAHLAPAIKKALKAAHEHVSIHCTKATPCRRRARKAR